MMKKNNNQPRIRILPYKQGSKSAKALADALGGKVLKLVGSKFRPRAGDICINWGSTQEYKPEYLRYEGFYNLPCNVKAASNKLKFFQLMKEDNAEIIPEFWTNPDDIPDEAFPVVCRTVLAGHSGAGIVIADDRGGLVVAPLYTKYIKKKDEYRVHCGKQGEEFVVISLQRKARREGFEEPNWQVRNHSNGFVFVRGDVNPPAPVIESAFQALRATGLDFGAVDVIWNDKSKRAYVLEINTAPGLEGQTVQDYANFFRN